MTAVMIAIGAVQQAVFITQAVNMGQPDDARLTGELTFQYSSSIIPGQYPSVCDSHRIWFTKEHTKWHQTVRKKNCLHSFTDQKGSGLSSCEIKPQDYMFLSCNRTLLGSIMQWHQKEDAACVCCVRLVQWQSSSAVLCPNEMCVCMCCCWLLLYIAILHSWGDSLHSCVWVRVSVCVHVQVHVDSS